jgi:hypothetical protein
LQRGSMSRVLCATPYKKSSRNSKGTRALMRKQNECIPRHASSYSESRCLRARIRSVAASGNRTTRHLSRSTRAMISYKVFPRLDFLRLCVSSIPSVNPRRHTFTSHISLPPHQRTKIEKNYTTISQDVKGFRRNRDLLRNCDCLIKLYRQEF